MNPSSGPDIRVLIEGIPYPTMILDKEFRITTMNRLMEAMTGYARERVLGVHGELVVRSNIGNTRGQLFFQVVQSGEMVSVKGDILNCYRRKIPVQCTISVLNEADGNTCGLMVIIEDISTREKRTGIGVRDFDSVELIGHSPKMQKVFDMIPLMAHSDASVLITGETGTGKDKIAEVIHQQSSRARYPFVKINCGALPLDLLESELFGHVKGAFTGASRNKLGMFKMADKGTLFLTEIGDMPLSLQVKLLSVLDDRKFRPVGGEQSISVDVKIIVATHRPLRDQVKQNKFREDLYYRLNVLHIHVPPLREREDDVRYLLDHFLDKYARALNKTIVGFTPITMQTLLDYHYPGNIRELSNIVEYAVNVCRRKKINKDDLPSYLFENQEKNRQEIALEKEPEELSIEKNAADRQTIPAPPDSGESWSDIERQMIIDALKEHGGNRTETSASLGWGRMKLWRKMKEYGLLK
jgi:PAS domain S-box-containing protein